MTLVLIWKNQSDIVVIADTLFRANGKPGLEIGPKIFSVPIRLKTFDRESEPQICSDMGFAFAGHTAAGQVTHAIATAGLQNLVGKKGSRPPSVEDVAKFYSRCAAYVVSEMRRHTLSSVYLFEGVVFGWQTDQSVAFSFDVRIDDQGDPICSVEPMDFEKFGLYAIGQGHENVQHYIHCAAAGGHKASPFDALMAVIADVAVPAVGGRIQAAVANSAGVELKPILRVSANGLAQGGFMGADQSLLGAVGDLMPLGNAPIIFTEGSSF